MGRPQVIAGAVVTGVVVALVALAAPVLADAVHLSAEKTSASAPATTPPASVDPAALPEGYVDLGEGLAVPAGGPGDCTTTSWLNASKEDGQPGHLTLLGPALVDMGPREFAQGTPNPDAEGRIATYTVAAGDAPWAIGDRFCLGNGVALTGDNHTGTLHPGDVIYLTPDPSIAWLPFYLPSDAPAGFPQAAYQNAMEAMGDAATAGDVETMRAIWSATLAPMTTDAADLAAAAAALDGGDLSVLRQMFP